MNLSEAINTIIQNRRSIYPYQYEAGAKVDDEIIWQILSNANCAPNHKKTAPWRFTVFTDDALKTFANLQVGIYKKQYGEENRIKLQKLADYPLMASHVIAIGMKRTEGKLPETEEILAIGCAIENMYLTASAYGLGCYLTTGGITYIEEAKKYFDLAGEDKLIGFFYVGKIKNEPTMMIRSDVREKVRWIDSKP